jgi:hypothetical protein
VCNKDTFVLSVYTLNCNNLATNFIRIPKEDFHIKNIGFSVLYGNLLSPMVDKIGTPTVTILLNSQLISLISVTQSVI